MNIFYLDKDTTKCAQYHVDKHVSKLILEAGQMIGTAIRRSLGEPRKIKYLTTRGYASKNFKHVYVLPGDTIELLGKEEVITKYQDQVYLNSYEKHPCTLWVQESLDNYYWLRKLVDALNKECLYRGYNSHLTWSKIQGWPIPDLPKKGLTPHARAFKEGIKDECMAIQNTVQAYRHYYMFGKSHLMEYTRRKPPAWMPQDIWKFDNGKYRLI